MSDLDWGNRIILQGFEPIWRRVITSDVYHIFIDCDGSTLCGAKVARGNFRVSASCLVDESADDEDEYGEGEEDEGGEGFIRCTACSVAYEKRKSLSFSLDDFLGALNAAEDQGVDVNNAYFSIARKQYDLMYHDYLTPLGGSVKFMVKGRLFYIEPRADHKLSRVIPDNEIDLRLKMTWKVLFTYTKSV